MANAVARACRCGLRIEPGQRCERCTKQRYRAQDERRGTATQRGYDATWRRLRAQVLSEEPLCRRCRELGRITLAAEVDHIVRIEDAPHRRLDRANLQPLCKSHHSEKTMRENLARWLPT